MKYFGKDTIKVQVVGSLYKHRLLHGKMKIINAQQARNYKFINIVNSIIIYGYAAITPRLQIQIEL